MKLSLPSIGTAIGNNDPITGKSTAITKSLEFAAKIGLCNLYNSQTTESAHKSKKKKHRSGAPGHSASSENSTAQSSLIISAEGEASPSQGLTQRVATSGV